MCECKAVKSKLDTDNIQHIYEYDSQNLLWYLFVMDHYTTG